MKLLEVCEPVFVLVCRVHRGMRKGVRLSAEQAQREVTGAIESARERASVEPGLARQFEMVEPVLVYFADAVLEPRWSGGPEAWRGIAGDRGLSGGDEEFFDLLDATLAESSEAATERLGVYFTCMGLGFRGWYRGQPEVLREKMRQIAARIGPQIEVDAGARICPEAYEHVNTSDLVQPQSRRLTAIGLTLAGIAAAVFVANVVLYREKRGELVDALVSLRATAEAALSGDAAAGNGGPRP